MSDLFLTSDYSLTLPSGGPTFGVHRLLIGCGIVGANKISGDTFDYEF
jgi:hypothetical protein